MKKHLRIYRFNMIEVVLAIVVVTLAITGVFVLFPVGLNASKSAIADDSISDIAEYVIAHVRADVQQKATAKGNGFEGFDGELLADKQDAALKDPYDGKATGNDTIIKKKAGLYLVRQLSGPDGDVEDFTAYAAIYKDEDASGAPVFQQYKKDGFRQYEVPTGQPDWVLERFLVPVVLELSYPANVPYEDRQKRYFRFEIFNHQFDPVAAHNENVSGS